MLLYEANKFSSLGMSNIDVEARDNYIGEAGAARALIESVQNDYAIFESLIQSDFQEAQLMREGSLNEATIQSIQEASGVGFIENIKKFLMNVWEKIKGFFKAFWNTLTAVVTRDNKKLVEKFRKKIADKDLKKLKVKYAKSKGTITNNFAAFDETSDAVTAAKAYKTSSDKEHGKEVIEHLKSTEKLDELYKEKTGIPGIKSESYKKDIHEYMFHEEEEQTGFSDSEISVFEAVLLGSSDKIKNLKKQQTAVDNGFKKILSELDSMRKVFETEQKGHESEDGYKDKAAAHQAAYLAAKAESTIISNIVACLLTEEKFRIKQARKVYVRAAGFDPKLVKEDADLTTAIEESSDFTVDEMFEYGAWV